MRAAKIALAAAFGACLAPLMPGSAHAAESEAALYNLLARNACSVAPDQVAALFAPEGFTPGFVRDHLTALLADGTATEDSRGRLSLPASLCPPTAPEPTPRDALLAEIGRNGCRVSDGEVRAMAAAIGLSDAQLRAILWPMRDAGSLIVEGRVATLDPAMCPGAPGSGG